MNEHQSASAIDETAILLIRDSALLPAGMAIESDIFVPGWRVVRNFDGYTLNRKMREADWSFVRLAGEYRARVVGRVRAETLRRGVSRILARLRGGKFNSLEISVVWSRLIGISILSITVNRRHIQDHVR